MDELKKILVVEDELSNAFLLKKILSKYGYNVTTANNGFDAFKMMNSQRFDALLTDWMMPNMDGIELIKQTRNKIKPNPFIMVITALVSDEARNYAIQSGADDYIAKPINTDELISRINDGIAKYNQETPVKPEIINETNPKTIPDFVAVTIVASSGGPPAIIEIFEKIPSDIPSAFYIVQHGPAWMLETFVNRLQKETTLKVEIAINGTKSRPATVYIAPGDKHLIIGGDEFSIILDNGPKENFVRPSADPLFRSIAKAFGKYCIAVILTGLGRDGAIGAEYIAATGGTIIVQNPETASAPAMPNTIIQNGTPHISVPLVHIAETICENIARLNKELILEQNQI